MKVKFDFTELDKLGRRIGRRASVQPYFKEVTTELGEDLKQTLKANTPHKTGELQNGWESGKITVRKSGTGYSITLNNTCEYANAVNYGHYSYNQHGGPYVVKNRTVNKSEFQGQIGDEEKFVYGVFFVEKSIALMETFGIRSSKRKVNRQMQKWFNTVINGKTFR